MDIRFQVKQYVTKIRLPNGYAFQVFITGDTHWLLFAQLNTDGIATGLSIPVKKSDLVRDWRKFSVP
jgi:hypothetical protein